MDEAPTEVKVERRINQYKAGIASGIGAAVILAGLSIHTLSDLQKLESGELRYTMVWRPVALIYQVLGKPGVIALFLLGVIAALASTIFAIRSRKSLLREIGAERFRESHQLIHDHSPAFLRTLDRNGRLPARTKAWLASLIFLILATIAAVKNDWV